MVKNLPDNAGDTRDVDLTTGSGRSPGVGNGTPLQYSSRIIPWREEHCGLQSMEPQRVRHDWATEDARTHGGSWGFVIYGLYYVEALIALLFLFCWVFFFLSQRILTFVKCLLGISWDDCFPFLSGNERYCIDWFLYWTILHS